MKERYIYLYFIFLLHGFLVKGQFSSWQWASALSSSNNEKGWDVAYDKNTNFAYLAGSFEGGLSGILGSGFSTTAGGKDGIITKYTPLGAPVWAIKIGGTADEEIKSIATDPFGNIYVTGYFKGTADFDPSSSSSFPLSPVGGSQDCFLAKYSSSGSLMWATKFGGNNTDDVWKMFVDSNAVYVTGSYNSSATFYSTNSVTKSTVATQGKNNFFGAKYDLNGVIAWVLSGGSGENDAGLDVVADKNKVFFTGSYERDFTIYNGGGSGTTTLYIRNQDKSDVFVICTNQSGNVIWATNAASQEEDEGHGIAQDANYIYITGSFKNNSIAFPYPSPTITRNNSGGTDIFIACLAKNNGTYKWVSAQTGSGNSDEEGYEIDVAPNGNVIVSGYFKNTLNYSSFGGNTLSSYGNEDIFISGYDNNGNFLWGQKAGANNGDFPHGITITPIGEIYLAGEYSDNAVFGLSTLPNASGVNMFVAKIGCNYISNNSISQTQTVCAGSTPVMVGSAASGGAAGTYTYTWEVSLDQLSWNVLQVSTSSTNYTHAPLYTSAYYRRYASAAQTCSMASVSNTIHIKVDSVSPPAIAGNDLSVCSSSFFLNGVYPAYGTASWSVIAGNVSILSPMSNTTMVSGLTNTVILRWTTKNGVCPGSYDDILIKRDLSPDIAFAGPDQKTTKTEIQLSANNPTTGTGYWSVIEGNGSIEDINNPSATAKLSDGNNTFRWTIKNGVCRENSDDITIYIPPFEIPNAFSPNDDNFNDEFVIMGLERYANVSLSVYNRWGSLVYHNPQYKNNWRGTNINNERLADDTYYYSLEIPGGKNYSGFLIIKQGK